MGNGRSKVVISVISVVVFLNIGWQYRYVYQYIFNLYMLFVSSSKRQDVMQNECIVRETAISIPILKNISWLIFLPKIALFFFLCKSQVKLAK